MAIKIGFLTGARSEYGVAKPLLKTLGKDKDISLKIYPNGMHLLNKFGLTVNEIKKDGFYIEQEIHTYTEGGDDKSYEFTDSIRKIYDVLKSSGLDAIFIIGDRIEAYTAALAAHFAGIPIIHSGGGTITLGAVDNYYRYNISNLSQIHFATSINNYNRLLQCPVINKENVHFVGSTAIDGINKFKDNPKSIKEIFPDIQINRFALMTFHPTTRMTEPIKKIMEQSIKKILSFNFDVLITYPNNDTGHEDILEVINNCSTNPNIYIKENLGAEGYYAASNDCSFVVGNSSSGIIEAPYFNKPVLNIGSRQQGRDKDIGVYDIPADEPSVVEALEKGFQDGWPSKPCGSLYGKGNSSKKIIEVIKKYFKLSQRN